MNDQPATLRTTGAAWEADHEVREELQTLLAELERRLEAKESDWRRAGLIPSGAIDDGRGRSHATH